MIKFTSKKETEQLNKEQHDWHENDKFDHTIEDVKHLKLEKIKE